MKRIPKHIIHYHPDYGFKYGLLSLGVLLSMKFLLLLYGFLANFHFIYAPISKSIKYLIAFDGFLSICGFLIALLFFSKLKKFIWPYLAYCSLLVFKLFFVMFVIQIHTSGPINPLTLFSYFISIILCCYIPYLLFAKSYRLTFLKLATEQEFDLIHKKMSKVKHEEDKWYQKVKDKILITASSAEGKESRHNQTASYYPSQDQFSYIPKNYQGYKQAQNIKAGANKATLKADFVSPVSKEHFARKNSSNELHVRGFLDQVRLAKNLRDSAVHNFKKVQKSFGFKGNSSQEKRSGHYSAQYTHIKTYAHKPEFKSKAKPLRIFLERLKQRSIATKLKP